MKISKFAQKFRLLRQIHKEIDPILNKKRDAEIVGANYSLPNGFVVVEKCELEIFPVVQPEKNELENDEYYFQSGMKQAERNTRRYKRIN